MTDHQKGLILTFVGGLVLSFDIPLLRLAHGEVWSVLLTRSAATVLTALLLWLVLRLATGKGPVLIAGRAGLAVGLLYGLATIFFMLSVFNTSTANVAFILAFNPMFGALLSWIFLKIKPPLATSVTMAVMIGGMVLIVGDGMEAGHTFGDFMAFLSALAAAGAITISRANGGDFGFAPLISTIFPALIAFYVVGQAGYQIAVPGWVIFNGLLVTPIAFWCLATGPRYLSAAEVGMFYLLETILAPVWVWLLFNDRPSNQVLLGGFIVLAALIAHSLWMVRRPAAATIR